MIDVKVESKVDEVLELTDEALWRVLWQIGAKAEGFAKDNTPVDTGRLRNSITFVTKEDEGKVVSYTDQHGNDFSYDVGIGLDDNMVAVGTNVEYAEQIEVGGHGKGGHHMLENAVSQHWDVYEKIIKKELESVKT